MIGVPENVSRCPQAPDRSGPAERTPKPLGSRELATPVNSCHFLTQQPAEGIEPTTSALQKRCSAVELRWQVCYGKHVIDNGPSRLELTTTVATTVRPGVLPLVVATNACLNCRSDRLSRGRISARRFDDCLKCAEHFCNHVSKSRGVSDLRPRDFHDDRQELLKRGISGRKRLGPYALNRSIVVVRAMFSRKNGVRGHWMVRLPGRPGA